MEEVNVMESIISTVTSLVTAAFGWVGTAIDTIEAEPILMIFVVGLPLVGLGVGLLKRLFRA